MQVSNPYNVATRKPYSLFALSQDRSLDDHAQTSLHIHCIRGVFHAFSMMFLVSLSPNIQP